MKKLYFFGFLLLFFVFSACDEGCADDCRLVEEGTVQVRLTLNEENKRVWVRVYQGDFENDEVLVEEWIEEDRVEYLLPVKKNYSVTASYRRGADSVVVINGGRLKVNTDECDCKEAKTLHLNLKLAE